MYENDLTTGFWLLMAVSEMNSSLVFGVYTFGKKKLKINKRFHYDLYSRYNSNRYYLVFSKLTHSHILKLSFVGRTILIQQRL